MSRSAISIPPWINPLYNLIDEHLRDIELAKQLMGDEGITKIYEMYFSAYTRNEFDEALERRMSNIKEFTEIKQMEYNAITHHNDPAYESNKKHFKAEEDALPGYLQKYFSRIIRVTRLREVRVLLGFTRVEAPDPDADEQPNVVALSKGKQERWLPAAEVNGEGIFIEFNKDTLAAWLNSPAVNGLSQKYSDSYREFCESKGWTITVVRNAVYVLMHTFAHLMIKQMLKRSCSELSDAHCEDIVASILGAMTMSDSDKVSLVVTAPPSFAIKARTTMNVVQSMINGADRNILITGYSLSSYFSELVDTIIQKSQRGVFVKFFVNDIDKQPSFDKILRYKGRFLKIYNYRQDDDKMAALHAKVISVDQQQTLITSANLSYHGQQGNIELGTLIESKQIAKQIDDIFTKLIFTKDFCEI